MNTQQRPDFPIQQELIQNQSSHCQHKLAEQDDQLYKNLWGQGNFKQQQSQFPNHYVGLKDYSNKFFGGLHLSLLPEEYSGLPDISELRRPLSENFLKQEQQQPETFKQNQLNVIMPLEDFYIKKIGNKVELEDQPTIGIDQQSFSLRSNDQSTNGQKKKDVVKNSYPSVMKKVFKKILKGGKIYDKKLQEIQQKIDQEDLSMQEFKDYCQRYHQKTKGQYSLWHIKDLMEFRKGKKKERNIKKMFYEFFIWYLEKRYTIEVIKSKQCENKGEYLRSKALLRYLPYLKEEVKC